MKGKKYSAVAARTFFFSSLFFLLQVATERDYISLTKTVFKSWKRKKIWCKCSRDSSHDFKKSEEKGRVVRFLVSLEKLICFIFITSSYSLLYT